MIITMLVLQLVIDILLVSVLLWMWWQDKNKQSLVLLQPPITAISESSAKELRKDMETLQQRVEEQLKQLTLLFDRTSRLFDQGGGATGYLLTSVEESELKAVVEMQKEKREIPSLEQLKVTQQRLKTESSFDLRTLLRGQLT